MSQVHDEKVDVQELIRLEAWPDIGALLAQSHPADVADIIARAPQEFRERLFSLLRDETKPDVLAEFEGVTGSEVLDSLTAHELSDIVEEMAPDDAADLLADLPEERSEQILGLMEAEDSEDVRRLLEYADDSAGGIMTTDVVTMHEDQTVFEALEAIAYLDTREKFYSAYIVDRNGCLTGYVDIWDLLREKNRSRPLGELADHGVKSVAVDMDQEHVARLMSRYDLDVIPVVDGENVLVGRVTADDVIEVMEEEASEDIFRLAGSDNAELESLSPLRTSMVRLPWLLITLVGGFVTSFILKHFHSTVSQVMVLASFVPVVLAMGGNTGIQSSTLVVRSIALGTLGRRSIGRLLLREIAVGAMMGAVCGTAIGLFANFMILGSPEEAGSLPTLQLAAVVAMALFSAMTFAAAFGTFVPVALSRLRVDPAVASGPFITITNDISALLIYFGVTLFLVGRFSGVA